MSQPEKLATFLQGKLCNDTTDSSYLQPVIVNGIVKLFYPRLHFETMYNTKSFKETFNISQMAPKNRSLSKFSSFSFDWLKGKCCMFATLPRDPQEIWNMQHTCVCIILWVGSEIPFLLESEDDHTSFKNGKTGTLQLYTIVYKVSKKKTDLAF